MAKSAAISHQLQTISWLRRSQSSFEITPQLLDVLEPNGCLCLHRDAYSSRVYCWPWSITAFFRPCFY
jgi:hypothetical protein